MKKICQRHGLTLVELIVASLLIAIVLLGVVAFNLSLNQIQDNSFNQSTLSTQASTAMNYLNDDIAMAIGTKNNSGVKTRSGSIPALCLRRPDNTPMSLIDNTWICYFLDGADKNLKRCVPIDNITIPDNTVDCTNPIINLVKLQSGNFFQIGSVLIPPGRGLIRITLNAQNGTDYYSMSTDIETKNHSR